VSDLPGWSNFVGFGTNSNRTYCGRSIVERPPNGDDTIESCELARATDGTNGVSDIVPVRRLFLPRDDTRTSLRGRTYFSSTFAVPSSRTLNPKNSWNVDIRRVSSRSSVHDSYRVSRNNYRPGNFAGNHEKMFISGRR